MQTATTYASIVSEHFLEVPKDLLFASAVIALLVALAMWKGKQVLFSLILAMYPSALTTPLVVTLLTPYVSHQHLSVLVFVLIIAIFYLPIRSIVGSFYHASGPKKWIEILLLGVMTAGLFFTLLLTTTTFESLFTFSEVMQTLFVGGIQTILWVTLPVLCLKLCK